MPATGSAPGDTSKEIATIITNFVETTFGPNGSVKGFLKDKGEVGVRNAIGSPLDNYTPGQVEAALRMKSLKGRQIKAKKKAQSSNMQADNNNNITNGTDADEKMGSPPESPAPNYHRSPVKTPTGTANSSAAAYQQRPSSRRRGNNGEDYYTHLHDDENQDLHHNHNLSPARSVTTATSPYQRRFIHAQRPPVDLESVTASLGDFSLKRFLEHSGDQLINGALPSKFGAEMFATITDKNKFSARAKSAATAVGNAVGNTFRHNQLEESELAGLSEEIVKEESNRNLNIDDIDDAIAAKRTLLVNAEKVLKQAEAVVKQHKVEMYNLEEKKTKAMQDKDEQLGKAKAFHSLGMHAYATLNECAQYGSQQLDDIKSGANRLINKHFRLQEAYMNGNYEVLNKAKSDGAEENII